MSYATIRHLSPNKRIELTPGSTLWRYAVTSVAGAVHARR